MKNITQEIEKLARMLDPTAIKDEYAAFKQIHEILRLISEYLEK